MQTATIGTVKNGKPVNGIVISYGLHYIKGNGQPYFTITCDVYRHGRWESGRSHHDLVLQTRPDLKPLVDLHLSDMNGVPTHAEANGWYWLAGAAGGLGERYHGGNHGYGIEPDECQAILASHLRITPEEAAALVQSAMASDPATARKQFAQYVEAQRPRWKAEADAAIKQFNLTVTGDHWK